MPKFNSQLELTICLYNFVFSIVNKLITPFYLAITSPPLAIFTLPSRNLHINIALAHSFHNKMIPANPASVKLCHCVFLHVPFHCLQVYLRTWL